MIENDATNTEHDENDPGLTDEQIKAGLSDLLEGAPLVREAPPAG